MSVTGTATLAVVLLGGAGCWFSYSASQASRRDTGPGSAEDLCWLHLQVAELHRQRGDAEAADRHMRFAASVARRRAGCHAPAARDPRVDAVDEVADGEPVPPRLTSHTGASTEVH